MCLILGVKSADPPCAYFLHDNPGNYKENGKNMSFLNFLQGLCAYFLHVLNFFKAQRLHVLNFHVLIKK